MSKVKMMSSKDKKKGSPVPRLRFPEFRDAGEWEETKLNNICDVLPGYGFPETLQGKQSGQYPFCKVSDISKAISDNGGLLKASVNYIDDTELFLLKAKLIPAGSTVFAKIGEALRLNRRAISAVECLIDNNAVGIKAKNKKATDYFLYILSQQIDLNGYCGGAVPSVNKTTLENIDVLIPSIPEQQKIADCLSSLDERITAESSKLDTLKDHKKGLLKQLFPAEGETLPQLRFPEFRDAGEWKKADFGKIAKFLSGSTPSKDVSEYWGGDIPWISASSMHNTKIEKSDCHITKLAISNGARIVPKGTLLLLVRGSMLHKRILLGISELDLSFNQDVKALALNADITELYLMYFLMASESKLLAAVVQTGIGAGKLDTDDLNNFPIMMPSPIEQQRIADCLFSLDELISAQTQKIDLLKTHKKGLMQQLFPALDEAKA